MKRLMLIFVGVLATACGGGLNSFNGTVAGNSFKPQSAVLLNLNVPVSGSSGGPQVPTIVLADTANLCSQLKANIDTKNETLFVASFLASSGGSLVAVTSGGYPVYNPSPTSNSTPPSGKVSVTFFDKTDSNCQPGANGKALTGTSGAIQLNSVSAQPGGHASGNFDIYFNSDHVTGDFSADYCDVQLISASGSASTCQ